MTLFFTSSFFPLRMEQTDKETLVKKINSLAKENFDQEYKGNVKNIELEGIYELAKNCYVTCHTAQLTERGGGFSISCPHIW